MADVARRIGRAKDRAGQFRHIWAAEHLPLRLKLRLYAAAVCSIMTYGSEGWKLDSATMRALNGANASMLSHITGNSQHEEASAGCTFDLVRWIRARRQQWLGHILRMPLGDDGEERLVKQAVRHIHGHRSEGDLLMDAPDVSWEQLLSVAADRDAWRRRVRALRMTPGTKWRNLVKRLLKNH